MTDDAAATVARLRQEMINAANVLLPGLDPRRASAAGALHGHALVAGAGLDAVLALHVRQDRPVISWDRLCLAHRDARGFADRQRGLRDCPDCKFSEIYVCRHCSCPNDFWPCPTYRAVLAALTGKEASGG